MNPILLKQRISKWIEACQYLKSAEIKEQLDTDEWTAIEELSNLWNKDFIANGVKDDALAHIDTLKRCEDMHPNNLKIKEMSKALTGVAREMLTKDEATYNEFKEALKKEIKQNRPVPKAPPTPKVPPRKIVVGQNPPRVPVTPRTTATVRDIVITGAEFRNTDYENNVIDNFGSTIRVGALYISSRLRITTDYYGSVTVKIRFTDPDGENRGVSTSTFDVSGSGSYITSGYGNRKGTFINIPGRWKLEYIIEDRLVYTGYMQVSPSVHAKDKVYVRSVLFADTDYDGNIIHDYGSTLYTDTKYLKPKVQFSTTRIGQATIKIEIKKPSGQISSYTDTVSFSGHDVELTLPGWGNKEGTSYSAGVYEVSFYADDSFMFTTHVRINSKSAPYTPTTPRTTYNPPRTTIYDPPRKPKGSGFGKFLKYLLIIVACVAGALWGLSKCGSDSNDDYPVEYAIADGVKLYQQPKMNSVVNQKLIRGTKIYLMEREGNTGWIKAKTDDGTTGYIHESYTLSEEMNSTMQTLFSNTDMSVQTKLDKMKNQVMKRQALAEMLRSDTFASTLKLVDVDIANVKPYESVAFIISDGNKTVAAAYKFDVDGVPNRIRYNSFENDNEQWASITSFTSSQMKIKSTKGRTVKIDNAQ